VVLVKQGREEEGRKELLEALRLEPGLTKAYYNLGTLLLRMGSYDEAIRPLKEAIRLDPRFADAFHNLAAVYAHLGVKASALEWLRQAIQLNPALTSEARWDDDFQSLRSDPDFLIITQP
jgi:tetratricopeptide (TPR) repeat protein